MGLAIPGRVIETFGRDGLQMARLQFGGIVRDSCVEYVPETQVGERRSAELSAEEHWDREREARKVLADCDPGNSLFQRPRRRPDRDFQLPSACKYPIRARTFESKVYEYYEPEIKATVQPIELEVTRRK
jgi:hypothetical protein